LGVAIDIGIVDPKNHRSTIAAGVKPIEDEGSSTSNMQKSSR
jgi:hypothetical protein